MHELPSAMPFAMRPMPPADWATLRNLVIVVFGSTTAALVVGLSCLGSGPIADGNAESVRSSAAGIRAPSAQTTSTSGEVDRTSPATGPAHRTTPPTPTTTPATPVPPRMPPAPATQVLPTVTAPPASGQQASPGAFATPLPSNAPPIPAEPPQPGDAHAAPPGVMVRGVATPNVTAGAGRLVAAPRDEPPSTPNDTPEER
jgi:hypothetical protein